ncbi:hypothetical protein NQ314_013608 [Rhamnusium bicolor]|uniref:Transposase n=1 Tax=Rhamnusium bicolor TaxID=1586634 RepID=A0AAV8X6M1_9CUCU|nr:hypothetical protein NQ314_013608 [Rhamnusium bicolor]
MPKVTKKRRYVKNYTEESLQLALQDIKTGMPKQREEGMTFKPPSRHSLINIHGPTRLKNNLPGEHWYQCFLRRYKALTNRTPEAVTNASGNVSETDIRKWFENIEHYLKEKDYFNILEDPTRVCNGDETYFTLCPKEDKVIAPRGAKNVYQIEQGPSKTNIPVMFTFSASGVTTPPMIVYASNDYQKILQRVFQMDEG